MEEIKKVVRLYDFDDAKMFDQKSEATTQLKRTLKELVERDNEREADGFPRRIRMGKITNKSGVGPNAVIVPTTSEPKFYHDNSVSEEDEDEGEGPTEAGTGEEGEGEILGERPLNPEQGEGEGNGAGEGDGANHEIDSNSAELGRILTEEFDLPNLKDKGKKRSITKFKYDLTDRNTGSGQLLDKKATLKKIATTNILLGTLDANNVDTSKLLVNPNDKVFRVMSREKVFESQAVVFFVRDYSGSMDGKPAEVSCTEHLFLYSWLCHQYQNRVQTRFILHDTNAKEVKDFYTYYKSQVAGGTKVSPAFKLVNDIIEEENLAKDNNIYCFYCSDGDDWDSGEETISELKKLFKYASRVGISIFKNNWGGSGDTTVEQYIKNSGMLEDYKEIFRMTSGQAETISEQEIINTIKKLLS